MQLVISNDPARRNQSFCFILAAKAAVTLAGLILFAVIGSCATDTVAPATPLERTGDEILVAGELFHTGTPIVLWIEPGGYDAYRTEYRFVPFEERQYNPEFRPLYGPQRYNLRADGLDDKQKEMVRGGGWPLDLLQEKVDLFVLHYDVCGTSKQCFNILHDHRGLSVHFMLDLDGTIYQTLDLKERAWHAGPANSRSVGIEIANIGAYPPDGNRVLDNWYEDLPDGSAKVTLPNWMGDGGLRTPDFVAKPSRDGRVRGEIHGRELEMYDLTDAQYDALIKLTAALCTLFPEMACDYPRDESGQLITTVLSDEQLEAFGGVIGHYHLTRGKIDPGPALDWDRVVDGARELMR